MQATTQYVSPVHVKAPQFMGCLNMRIMYTLCGIMLRTSSPRFRKYADGDGETGTGGNFRLSYALPRYIRTAQVITQPQKLHSHLMGLLTAVIYQVTGLMRSFFYGMGLQPAGVIHNNLVCDARHCCFSSRYLRTSPQ